MREYSLFVPSNIINSNEIGIVTRFVVGAMMLSHEIRRDVRVNIVFNARFCITFNGKSMRNVRPDESSLSGILRAGLSRRGRVLPGVVIREVNIEKFLSEAKGAKLFYSERIGRIQEVPEDFFIIFQYPKLEIEEILLKMNFSPIKLGKRNYFPDQAAVILNNRLDRKLFGI
ncbi:MAG: hypothetical protein NZ922_00405 [Candidatus Methanomethyliaceae archaeon]|nr:hypothetical protein [Candidatus Methanomethyliaceae archaeon]MDW7970465.1 hypothetical protein [Nitrososphaerota archaeon]